MQGILSLLDSASTERVIALYAGLEARFGLRGIQAFAYPHVSYHILNGYDLETVQTRLRDMMARFKPVKTHATGLGIFLQPAPVVFIPVVRSTPLEHIHRLLWRAFPSLGGKGEFYVSDQWMPHITLARGDLTREMLPEVIGYLSEQDFHWQITLDNLTFATEMDERFVIQCTYKFVG